MKQQYVNEISHTGEFAE